ncbi:hypothetical protein GIB67_026339 [Kingdonia uniflora]|uniref:Uncharacterized protein n=1 Tax=Kingdonia uniflora TaxID=39325 RepID=A0A7J7P605_9MAGN|nr:hypothetical protein GIB67_026339 [Kingdonia uniflora]
MTILRSRVINPKSPPKSRKPKPKPSPSPSPSLITKQQQQNPNLIPPSPSTTPNPDSPSTPLLDSSPIVPRRSLRLSWRESIRGKGENSRGLGSKLKKARVSDEGNVSCEKGVFYSVEGIASASCESSISVVENVVRLEGLNVVKVKTKGLRSKLWRREKVGVMGSDEKLSFNGDGGNEEEKGGSPGCASELGDLGSSPGSLKRRSERLEGKGKRKLDVDLNVVPRDVLVISSDDDDKGFSELRLGGKFSKTKLETGVGDSNGTENMGIVGLVANGTDDVVGSSEVNLNQDLVNNRRRYSREEKGKAIVETKDNWLSIGMAPVDLDLQPEVEDDIEAGVLGLIDDAANGLLQMWETSVVEQRQRQETLVVERQRLDTTRRVRSKAYRRRADRERHHDMARENAHRFAHFQPEEEEERPENGPATVAQSSSPENEKEIEDWPGPFSTAMKIIKDRATKSSTQPADVSKVMPVIKWVPSKDLEETPLRRRIPPSLRDLCMNIVVNNAADVVSLEDVPDVLRNKLCQLLCDSRRMDFQFFDLLVRGSPTEIRVNNCSWMKEEQATDTLGFFDKSNLTVLQLDLCGRCMPDYILQSTLARSPNSLPALVAISLRGACRITDVGLKALAFSAPALRSVNLGQCSLLSSDGINALADSLGLVLRELYIDDCQSIDAMSILPALKKIQHLEVLSVAGIQTVCDDFVHEYVAECGSSIKELVLGNCGQVPKLMLRELD